MHAVLFFANNGLCGITSSTSTASCRSRIHGREIADGARHVASQRSLLQPSCSIFRSEGNRRGHPQRNISSEGTEKTGKLKDLRTSDNETPRPYSRDEIIALFRRIQKSISKEGSTGSRRRSQNNSIEKHSAESLLGTLRQYPIKKQTEEAQNLEEVEGSLRSSDTLEDEEPRDDKASRPMSNFVKKSPIRPPLFKEYTKIMVEEQVSETRTEEMSELQKLDGMKLTELKELAKRKGVKGYSKLKKGELLELLKGVLQSSS